MLNDTLKEEIQSAYSRLLEQKGYRPRQCQKSMIAEIARTLGDLEESENRVCVIEAGTGTGKTLAYALAAMPVARQYRKKLVIATATVALQEQIVYQDLPDIRQHAELDFSFALAKGRRRYLCLARLDAALQDSPNQSLALFADSDAGGQGNLDTPLYESMLNALGHGEWDGERDSWPQEVDHVTWSRVSTDHAQCTGRQCSHYENCYFYRAREQIHRVDCIVTNQDLVLSDLMMGGGAVLPDPEETIYVFDEGHHLPEKAGHHFAHSLAVYSTRNWLLQIPTTLKLAAAELPDLHAPAGFNEAVDAAIEDLDTLARELQQYREQADPQDEGWRYRFPEGRLDLALTRTAGALQVSFDRLAGITAQLAQSIEYQLEQSAAADREAIEQWLSVFNAVASRLSAGRALWSNYSVEALEPPYARWIRFSAAGQVEGMEMQLTSHPVSVSDMLHETLWSRCAAAVVTSATISVAGDFSSFQQRSGIAPANRFVSLPSPFRFSEQAVLQVPRMTSDPGDAGAHTAEITAMIPGLLARDTGSLVLFSSWRQMLRVYDDIDGDFRQQVLMQGDRSKIEMLRQHRARIDAGQQSCLFGLASFAEGVDLPGAYCSHVIIAKIPFAVPDDPVDATLSEWVEARGGNAFYQVMLPNAALRVVQAAGRLLRTESDSGTVTILDRRLVTRRYGQVILDALPPFRREIS